MSTADKHYACMDCSERWTLSGQEQMDLMRMTPTCPECGSVDVCESFLPPDAEPK